MLAFFKKKISSRDICYFSRQMATLITAGIPLVQACALLSQSAGNNRLRALVHALKTEIEEGVCFSNALRQHPSHFDPFFCNLVETGERCGSLEIMLERLATHKEKVESIKRKVKKALFYPCTVIVITLIITVILFTFVIPQFEQLFQTLNTELPKFTKMIICISTCLKEKGLFILGGLFTTGGLFRYFQKRSLTVQRRCDRFLLTLPFLGTLFQKIIITHFARTLATTYSAGLPLDEALLFVANTIKNTFYKTLIYRIRQKMLAGASLQSALGETLFFPVLVTQMIAVGEETGALDQMLTKLATHFEEEIDMVVEGTSRLLEPVIMVILGILVGSLVIAMYLPIFKMNSIGFS